MGRKHPNVIKHGKQRRAWAKSLQRRGMMQPNREVIRNYKDHARGLEDREFVDRVAAEVIPDFKRRQQLYRQAQIEAGLPEGCDQRVLGPTGKDALQESWIYSNAQRNCFVLVHTDWEQEIERKSMAFLSIEVLMMCWEGGAINWVDKRKVTKPE
jgi:hypothetical protein